MTHAAVDANCGRMTILEKAERYSQVEADRNRLADALQPGWSRADPATRPSIEELARRASWS